MSIIDKYAEYKVNRSSQGDMVFRRIWDPNFLTPDIFFVMDEIGEKQVLRKFHTTSGVPAYCGTYHVIFKTEDMDRFCLIMRRIRNEWAVSAEYENKTEFEENTYIVAEYYPGTHSRIYLKGLSEQALDRVIRKYECKTRKKLTMK
ncbi:MAG: hypothetical protein E7226_03120 [Clostridiales bacterium]|nr:hypothetical protein [Clostridiales bacterium]